MNRFGRLWARLKNLGSRLIYEDRKYLFYQYTRAQGEGVEDVERQVELRRLHVSGGERLRLAGRGALHETQVPRGERRAQHHEQ